MVLNLLIRSLLFDHPVKSFAQIRRSLTQVQLMSIDFGEDFEGKKIFHLLIIKRLSMSAPSIECIRRGGWAVSTPRPHLEQMAIAWMVRPAGEAWPRPYVRSDICMDLTTHFITRRHSYHRYS
jgi:hypothetical protein